MHPTRKARRRATSRTGNSKSGEAVPRTEAPTSDLEARHGSTEQIDPRLPHERDESASPHGTSPQPLMQRAHRDLAEGQTDTDCRNATEETIARKSGHGLRRKP